MAHNIHKMTKKNKQQILSMEQGASKNAMSLQNILCIVGFVGPSRLGEKCCDTFI